MCDGWDVQPIWEQRSGMLDNEGKQQENLLERIQHNVWLHAQFMDPYCCKLHGIYCILLCLKYLCGYCNITEGGAKVVCNCKGTLQSSIDWDKRPTSGCKHFDLLWSIFEFRKEIPMIISREHVYGYQDNVKKI